MPTFNYTGRTRIDRSRISVSVDKSRVPWRAHVSVDLTGLNLPSNARVYFEPYYGPIRERHPLGRASDVAESQSVSLEDLTSRPGVLFRIKVVDPAPGGKLLAHADRVPLTAPVSSQREEIIKTDVDDLNGSPWRIDFTNELPVLLIDTKIGHEIFDDVKFRSLVFPAVLRQVLFHIEFIDPAAEDETEDGLTWQGKWRLFVEQIGAPPRPRAGAEPISKHAWIDDCVNVFSRHFNLVDAIIP